MLISSVLRSQGTAVERILSTEKVADAVTRMSQQRIGALAVEDLSMRIVGTFSEREVVHSLAREGKAALSRPVSELMCPLLTTCSESDRIDTVLAKMKAAHMRHIPVVENNILVGIINIGDLVQPLLAEDAPETHDFQDLAGLNGVRQRPAGRSEPIAPSLPN
jgi:CBS domain-containing protein